MSRKNRDTRSDILKATWELLEGGRGNDVRMTDIAKKAGVSRQAVYMHFQNRTDLLIATTLYIDVVKNIDERLAKSRNAQTGTERVRAFLEAWCNYIPEIYGVAKALMIMGESDEAARNAWSNRLRAVREGCRAAIDAIHKEGKLLPEHSVEEATDLLCAILSVQTWENLVLDSGWPQERYVEKIKSLIVDSIMTRN